MISLLSIFGLRNINDAKHSYLIKKNYVIIFNFNNNYIEII